MGRREVVECVAEAIRRLKENNGIAAGSDPSQGVSPPSPLSWQKTKEQKGTLDESGGRDGHCESAGTRNHHDREPASSRFSYQLCSWIAHCWHARVGYQRNRGTRLDVGEHTEEPA